MIALNDVQLKTLMTAAAGMSRYHPDTQWRHCRAGNAA